MSSNVVFVGWNRSIPGREGTSAADFQEFAQYVGGLQQTGAVKSFEAVLLDPHGGDLNGFFLIRGETAKLDAVIASDAWQTHITRGRDAPGGVGCDPWRHGRAGHGANGSVVQADPSLIIDLAACIRVVRLRAKLTTTLAREAQPIDMRMRSFTCQSISFKQTMSEKGSRGC